MFPALARHLETDGAPWEEGVAPAPRAMQPAGEDLAQHGEVREAFSEEVALQKHFDPRREIPQRE